MQVKLGKATLISAAALVAGIILLFAVGASLKALLKGYGQSRALKVELASVQSSFANIKTLKSRLDGKRDRVKAFELGLIEEEEINLLLEELSSMASSSRVKIQAIRPQKPSLKAGAFYMEFPILIEAKCGYHSLGIFVNKLENARYFLNVKDVKINYDSNDPANHDSSLVVYGYTKPKER